MHLLLCSEKKAEVVYVCYANHGQTGFEPEPSRGFYEVCIIIIVLLQDCLV